MDEAEDESKKTQQRIGGKKKKRKKINPNEITKDNRDEY